MALERRRTPETVLLMLWVAAAIYYGAKSLEPREDMDDLDLLPIPNMPSELPGVPNFRRVTDDLLRGGQPTATGFRALKAIGVKTIVNVRHYHSDRWMIEPIGGLDYERMSIKSWSLYGGHVMRFLEVVTDKSRTPVFLHCHDGVGRTGVLCAMYRIVVCGWSREEAIREMREAGPWEDRWFNKMLSRMEEMDPVQMRRALGLPEQIARRVP
mgnify:CR=1 FL=1